MAIKQPTDKSHFILPDLGEGVHEAELIKWRVSAGDQVDEHQTLAEMETDKALVEVPSPWTGVIKKLHGAEGDIIIVGSTLVSYRSSGGDAAVTDSDTSDKATADEPADAGTVVGSVDSDLSVPASFTRDRRAEETAAAATTHKALATPAVRRVARELGLDINAVPGSGRGGRVTASDVHGFANGRGGTTAPVPVAPPTLAPVAVDADGVSERIPFRGVRRKIAEALDRSVKTAVHFTVTDEADVTALNEKRGEYSRVLGHRLSFLPFVMTAVCHALRKHPRINAIVDDQNSEILVKGVINLGIAVDTEHGLMVPVIPDADTLGLTQLSDSVTEIALGCRDRTIDRERLTGSTFTISNVGSSGGMFATPIINYPEVGVLAVGRVKERVLTKDGMFYAGRVMPLSMSCDHRVVDGAESARFLNRVVTLLESPESLFGSA